MWMRSVFLALALSLAVQVHAEPVSLLSPDGQTAISIDDKGGIRWSLRYRGEALLDPSPLSLSLTTGPYRELRIAETTQRTSDTIWKPVAGRSAEVRDHFNEATLSLREEGSDRTLKIIFRAYDHGVAFRYVLPAQLGHSPADVRSEGTGYRLAADLPCWGALVGRYDTNQETVFDPIRISQIRETHLFSGPLTCTTPSGAGIAFAEADVREWPGSYFMGASGNAIAVSLSPRVDEPMIAVRTRLGSESHSPWRVVMLAPHMGKLIESSLIATLSAPSRIADTSWIKPGKSAWDWFARVPPGGTLPTGSRQALYKQLIDFAGASKLDYLTLDVGWHYGGGLPGEPGSTLRPGVDITRPRDDVDMPSLVAYARERGVRLIVWVHWATLDQQLDEALAQYQAWGLAGIKVDYMNRDDQQMVAWYQRVMRRAADHKLLVNMHGAYKPTGLTRTWPNYITQEGVLGAEHTKWGDQATPTHNVTLPYTRMLVGPMDYTPGGFRHDLSKPFVPGNMSPRMPHTRGHALAMYVVYESPLQYVADHPAVYAASPAGFDFLVATPTSWDETRFITGEIGQSIVLARRKGNEWWIGAMTNEQGRTLTVPLDFLSDGRWRADIRQDGAAPDQLTQETRTVDRRGTLSLVLAGSGGAAVRLTRR